MENLGKKPPRGDQRSPSMTTPPVQIVTTVAELRAALEPARRAGRQIGLVPTMGALHEGHLSLVRASKAECDLTVVSIYVNPSQFAPGEDLAKYPRTLESDLDKLAACQADLVLAPGDAEVYRPGPCHLGRGGRGGRAAGGAIPAGPFPRRGHDRAQAVQHGPARRRLFRPEGLPADAGRAADGRRPERAGRDPRLPDRPRAGRPGDEFAERLSQPGGPPAGPAVLWQSLEAARQLVGRGQRDAETIARAMRETILLGRRCRDRLRRPGRSANAPAGADGRPARRWPPWRSGSTARG